MNKYLIGIAGIALILGLALLLSTNRRAIRLRVVGPAFALQAGFAVLVLGTAWGRDIIGAMSRGVCPSDSSHCRTVWLESGARRSPIRSAANRSPPRTAGQRRSPASRWNGDGSRGHAKVERRPSGSTISSSRPGCMRTPSIAPMRWRNSNVSS